MTKLTRRQFMGASAGSMLAVGAGLGRAADADQPPSGPAQAAPFDKPISFQSFGMRREIEADFTGTLKQVKALGFDGIEMCSPNGNYYKQAGFGNLTAVPPADIKRQIEDAGLFCESAHFEAHEVLVDDLARTIDFAAAFGLKDIFMSGSTFGEDGTVDDIKRWGERCNEAGAAVKEAGMRLGYHNHLIGPMVGEKPQYEHIMEALDPDLITMQFQFAAIMGGYDLEYYLDKYAGRYSSLHLSDYDPALKGRQPGRLGRTVPIGEGMVDWPAVLQAAMKSAIADYGFIVEMETSNPLEDLRRSITHLKAVSM